MTNQQKAPAPAPDGTARLCLSLTAEGLTAYGNRAALTSLRDQLTWMIASDPAEHFECHVLMTLETDASRFDGATSNVWTLVSEDLAEKVVILSEEHPGFELTLMHAEEADLDKLASYRPSGIKP
jgi:hypothetical protein